MKTTNKIILITIIIGIVSCNSKKNQASLKEESSLITKTEKKKKALTDYENLKFSAFYQDFKNEISGRTLISTNSPGKITGIILAHKEKGHYVIGLDTTSLKPDMPKVNQYWEFSQIENIVIKEIKFIEKNNR